MKKIFIFTVIGAAVSASAIAGFINDTQTDISVTHAKEMRDEMPVQLKGNITQSLGDEKYLFSDGKETIIVEIDDEGWQGQNVSPKDTVLIVGEMDKDIWGTEIDVETVQLIK